MNNLSHSQLEMYNTCARKYRYRYVEHVPGSNSSSVLAFGRAVHQGLDRVYAEWLQYGLLDIDGAVKKFRDELIKAKMTEPFPCTEEQLNGLLNQGEKIIREKEYTPENVISTERSLYFKVGEYPFVAKLDRLDLLKDGSHCIVDYKTGSRLPTVEELVNNRQILLYAYAVQQNFGRLPTLCILDYVKFDKQLEVPITRQSVDDAIDTVIEDVRRIQRDTDYERKKTPLCKWCEYEDLCKDDYISEYVPAYANKEDADNDKIREYLDLYRNAQELDIEVKKIKKEMDRVADELPLGKYRVDDDEVTLEVLSVQKKKYPGVNDERHSEMVQLLHDQGADSEVMMVSTARLMRYLQTAPDAVVEKLDEMATNTSTRQVKIKQLSAGKGGNK
jgi:CRISPR/Cas system-associated exonuclease Cas4 (RecB family)